MEERETYLLRVWLPDRPGALGAVASRLGELDGDVSGLEIVERGGGLAIDELVLSMPSGVSTADIIREVSAEMDVEVEDLRKLAGSAYDPELDALEAAAIILRAETRDELAAALCENVCRVVRTSWGCVMEFGGAMLGSWGDRPNDLWLDSFVSGSPSVETTSPSLEVDTVWIPLPAADAALIVGRDTALRARERHRIAALARIADAWFRRLKEQSDRQALASHPSRT